MTRTLSVRVTALLRAALKTRGACAIGRPFAAIRPLSMSPQADYGLIDGAILIEEETVRGYKAEDYYPIHIGQTFQGRYQTVGKLGYVSASTVWLSRDLQRGEGYVPVKIYINNSKEHRELSICQHINIISSEHPGREHVRKLLDSFEIQGPHEKHMCLVYEPLGNSLGELSLLADGILEAPIIRQTMRPVLTALEFFAHRGAHNSHRSAKAIMSARSNADTYQDLQPNNLLGIHDNSILAEFEQEEKRNSSPRKELEDRTIYVSRPMPLAKGLPSLSDFSEARFGDVEQTGRVMPDVYGAPEVILGMPWSYPIDVWAFAMAVSWKPST